MRGESVPFMGVFPGEKVIELERPGDWTPVKVGEYGTNGEPKPKIVPPHPRYMRQAGMVEAKITAEPSDRSYLTRERPRSD